MKKILFCCWLYGCSSQANNKNFISGIYCREVTNEYSIGKDTLVIGAINETTYSIIHKATYQRIKEHHLLPPERKFEKWTASYDEHNQTLNENKRGKIILFDALKDILLVGSSIYKKIK